MPAAAAAAAARLFVCVCVQTMAAHPDQYIACPRPNCPQYVVASRPGEVELCECPCGFVFCSLCREKYHGQKVSCAAAKEM